MSRNSRKGGGKVRKRTDVVNGKSYDSWQVDLGVRQDTDDTKRRVRRSFRRKADAERWLAQQQIEQGKLGEDALSLTLPAKKDAANALRLLAGTATLTQAATFFIRHTNPSGGRRTVKQAFDDYVLAKKESNVRPATLSDLNVKIGRFVRDFADTAICEISTEDINEWFRSAAFTPATKKSYLGVIRGFFQYALKNGLIAENPARPIDTPRLDETEVLFLRVDQVRALMQTAIRVAPAMIPYFALCTFAGIRPEETRALDWSAISFATRTIRIPAKVSKTRRRRIVDMSPNLIEWLLLEGSRTGKVYFSRRLFDKVRKEAGLYQGWVKDVLRHSAATYHYALHEHIGKTAKQLGDQVATTAKHYADAGVTQDIARQFWAIRPGKQRSIHFQAG